MPKQKTHRGAAKRFSLTKSGLVKHKKMNANHILNKKTTKRIRTNKGWPLKKEETLWHASREP